MPILTLIMLSHLLFCITNYVNNNNQFLYMGGCTGEAKVNCY